MASLHVPGIEQQAISHPLLVAVVRVAEEHGLVFAAEGGLPGQARGVGKGQGLFSHHGEFTQSVEGLPAVQGSQPPERRRLGLVAIAQAEGQGQPRKGREFQGLHPGQVPAQDDPIWAQRGKGCLDQAKVFKMVVDVRKNGEAQGTLLKVVDIKPFFHAAPDAPPGPLLTLNLKTI